MHSLDVIFGTESWLKLVIKVSEVFPNGYVVYRKDQDDGYGGVFVASRETLATSDVQLTLSSCELVACFIFFNRPYFSYCLFCISVTI